MTESLRVLVADPAVRMAETGTETQVVAGINASRLAWLVRQADWVEADKQDIPDVTARRPACPRERPVASASPTRERVWSGPLA